MFEWFSSAVASANAAKEITQSLLTLRDEELVRSRVFDLTNNLMELQQQLMNAQVEQMGLVQRITQVEEQLRLSQAKTNVLDRYELQTVGGGKFVYAMKSEYAGSEPEHFCCTKCFDDGKRSIMKGGRPYGAQGWMKFICPNCDYSLGIDFAFIPDSMKSR
ncbi:hypothetical protein [Pseudomonas veronii]|uniref:Uncharacterized protein n=1 Tax=Pseudomonas veronii TaxID=76761 RepID=A0A5M8EU24_PSEVE|nr:hypothetical protein [Pseudomonas veronii]KAA6167187.1 hypothetical protein F3K54_30630 [Pseudomonas veronii]KAA6172722.1 hypothetical protein F3K53_24485 [Pseudomonas veronii]